MTMNEKQPLLGPSAVSQHGGGGACQGTWAWPLDRRRIWQELTSKQLWIDTLMGLIVQIILTAIFLPHTLSQPLVALYRMVVFSVPVLVGAKLVVNPLLDSLFGACFMYGRRFPRLGARQPILPLYRLDVNQPRGLSRIPVEDGTSYAASASCRA